MAELAYALTNDPGFIRLTHPDGRSTTFAVDPFSSEYQRYLSWLAENEQHQPSPADPEPEPLPNPFAILRSLLEFTEGPEDLIAIMDAQFELMGG